MKSRAAEDVPSGWSETVGECDDDYCTGCEPGCTLETLYFEGPLFADEYQRGPLEKLFVRTYAKVVRQSNDNNGYMMTLTAKELKDVEQTFKQNGLATGVGYLRVVVRTGDKEHGSRLVPTELAKLIKKSADREDLKRRLSGDKP